ncbi:DNA gyrase/topoisomerase IV subunit B [Embleya sp. AB8]
MAGFRDGMVAAINAYAREQGLLSSADPDLDVDRIAAGLTAVVSVKLDRPEFHGATRDMPAGAVVHTCVEDTVREHLGTWPADHPQWAAAVVGRISRGARRD